MLSWTQIYILTPTLTVIKTAFFHLRNIAKVRPFINQNDAEKLIHAFISSRLDYCNSLFAGLPKKTTERLQLIQNSAARLLTKTKRREHISPVLASLHWLPVTFRIDFKVLLLTYKALNGQGPSYIANSLTNCRYRMVVLYRMVVPHIAHAQTQTVYGRRLNVNIWGCLNA